MARCTPKSPKFGFAAAGYTPLEAIVACTKENAFAVGLEDQVGMLIAGKLADVIILRKDAAADVPSLQDPCRSRRGHQGRQESKAGRSGLRGDFADILRGGCVSQ